VDQCKFEGCTRVMYAVTTGYCRSHHGQFKRTGNLTPLRGEWVTCLHVGCESRAASRGYCQTHYFQFKNYGNTYGPGSPVHCKVVNCKRPVTAVDMCQRHAVNGEEWVVEGTAAPCQVGGCNKPAYRGFCRWHKEHARKFGLSWTQYLEITGITECEACGVAGVTLDIHHSHECCNFTGSCGGCVVAALCSACNRGAGLVRDNPETLRKLADIMERGPMFPGNVQKEGQSSST
jgi:hypothetical protein